MISADLFFTQTQTKPTTRLPFYHQLQLRLLPLPEHIRTVFDHRTPLPSPPLFTAKAGLYYCECIFGVFYISIFYFASLKIIHVKIISMFYHYCRIFGLLFLVSSFHFASQNYFHTSGVREHENFRGNKRIHIGIQQS